MSLPAGELAEVLEAENRSDLFIDGNVDHATETITFCRGDLTKLTVPFSTARNSTACTASETLPAAGQIPTRRS